LASIDYVRHLTPRAKICGYQKRGMAWGMGEVVATRFFYIKKDIFFSSFNAPTAYHEKRGLTLNAPKNVFWW